jgi:hypothetical protein
VEHPFLRGLTGGARRPAADVTSTRCAAPSGPDPCALWSLASPQPFASGSGPSRVRAKGARTQGLLAPICEAEASTRRIASAPRRPLRSCNGAGSISATRPPKRICKTRPRDAII